MSAVVVCVLFTVLTVGSALGLMVTTIRRDRRRNADFGAAWEAELARRNRSRRKEQPRAISAGGAQ